jgi:hypothetical protein
MDGKPIIGTWDKAFDKVDLMEIRKPFRNPLLNWVKYNRIKEWQCFSAHDENHLLEVLFCNYKHYKKVQLMLYDKKNKKKQIFRKLLPGSGWQLPQSLINSTTDGFSSNFLFRIHNWLDADIVTLSINIQAIRRQPSLTVHLEYNVNYLEVTPMVVSLGFSEQRTMYAFKAHAPVHGEIIYDRKKISLKQDTCSGFFCDYKGFYPYRMYTTTCYAMGFDTSSGKRFGFHIAENQAKETNKNNENALWLDGELTPLPPVLITMPYGLESIWVIQDIEGMIDLTFTPKEQNTYGTNLLFSEANSYSPMGLYNGMLVTSSGEKIIIKNLFGIGEKLFLRV